MPGRHGHRGQALNRYTKAAKSGNDKMPPSWWRCSRASRPRSTKASPPARWQSPRKSSPCSSSLCLITAKPAMFVGNVSEDGFEKQPLPGSSEGICCQPECSPWWPFAPRWKQKWPRWATKTATCSCRDGQTEPGLARLIRGAFKLLGLQTYFTAGVKEVRAWTIHIGDTAPQAAGVIHARLRARLHSRADHSV